MVVIEIIMRISDSCGVGSDSGDEKIAECNTVETTRASAFFNRGNGPNALSAVTVKDAGKALVQ